MPLDRPSAIAIHVCGDGTTRGLRHQWPPSHTAPDTTERLVRICGQLGIAEQRRLAGDGATADAVRAALRAACATLASDGLLVLTFSGHTERGDGPIETARWCLTGGGLELAEIAGSLTMLPASAQLLVVCDSCYASAIASVLHGPQQTVVLAGCGDDQTMLERVSSEFVVRLEAFACADGAPGSLDALRVALEADTPDCERPVVWTNAEHRWSAAALPRVSCSCLPM